MNKEIQKKLIEEKIALIQKRRTMAPPEQQAAIDTAVKFMTRATKNIDKYFDERSCANTIMRTPQNNEECEELHLSSPAHKIIMRVLG